MQQYTYTQDQMDIALLKNTQDVMFKEINGLGQDISSLRAEIKVELHSMRDEIKSQGHWNMGLILGVYAMIGASALGKIFGVL